MEQETTDKATQELISSEQSKRTSKNKLFSSGTVRNVHKEPVSLYITIQYFLRLGEDVKEKINLMLRHTFSAYIRIIIVILRLHKDSLDKRD